MKFLCIVYGCDGPTGEPAEHPSEMMTAVLTNNRELQDAGHLIASSPLQPASTAVTVQVRRDEVTITDGPFAETKEQVGGFYLIEADSMKQAVELTAAMPPAQIGAIEVRALNELPVL